MDKNNYKLTLITCCLSSASSAVAVILSPLLFTTFHKLYNISYSLLGLLVVINFATQLLFDLIYSFFSAKINIKVSTKLIPVLMLLGLIIYALSPIIFKTNCYIGIAIGTVFFSIGCGLAEVLGGPVATSIPSENPNKNLGKLHASYAWGLLVIVVISAIFLSILGGEKWQILTIVLAVFPLIASVLMIFAPIPPTTSQENIVSKGGVLRNKTAILFIICIFFAGASEQSMCQWSSGYLETVFKIDKTLCDLIGLGLFGAFLALGRTLYTRFGRNIDRPLIFGSIGATICYVMAVFIDSAVVGLIVCALSGFFVSMLWPGSLMAVTDRITDCGVSLFALMAVGGDLGATIYPQAIGLITDGVIANKSLVEFGKSIGLTAEQFGLKVGMIFAITAPLFATIFFLITLKRKDKNPLKPLEK